MEIKASAKYLHVSPRKLRLLANGWKGVPVLKVLEKLEFYPQRGTELLEKVFKQAIANAKNNFKLAEEDLVVKTVEVGEGRGFKKMDKSHGARFDRGLIKRKTAHLFITLETKEKKKVVKKEKE
ncbi:MAG: uL22 family ribosomal protein [Patescibacteria group bacterium]|nr:uL22 family ribosomal protein [Patescibacteria group bacterium]